MAVGTLPGRRPSHRMAVSERQGTTASGSGSGQSSVDDRRATKRRKCQPEDHARQQRRCAAAVAPRLTRLPRHNNGVYLSLAQIGGRLPAQGKQLGWWRGKTSACPRHGCRPVKPRLANPKTYRCCTAAASSQK